jgi:Ser/Thr protein kinase RdoA (MazF antagonist)
MVESTRVAGSRYALPDVLGGSCGVDAIRQLACPPLQPGLAAVVPPAVSADVDLTRLQLVRTKFKPGRSLTAEYLMPRTSTQAAVRWTVDPPPNSPWVDAQPWRDGWVSVLVSPSDRRLPQLARLMRPGHLNAVLGRLTDDYGTVASDISISTIRYRPGQRHVLRVNLRSAKGRVRRVFVKIDRDDRGRQAVHVAKVLSDPLTVRHPSASLARPVGYAADDQAALWWAVPGRTLGEHLRAPAGDATPLVVTVGRALRSYHACGVDAPHTLLDSHDAVSEWRATQRAGEIIFGLLPEIGEQYRAVGENLLTALRCQPVTALTCLHGDAKADNLVVEGDRVIFLDLDRCAWGDPALDLGKLIADLRWWAGVTGADAADLVRGLRVGYGDGAPGQWERARLLAVMFQLKLAARRTPIHLPGWTQRIGTAVAEAAQYLAMEAAA